MQAALDATVLQKGVYTLTHHAGRWIRSDQVIALVDHAVKNYGKKVMFLNFREVNERLVKNFLGGVALRAADGGDNGVRVLDLNADGYMDVVIGNEHVRQTRLWSPKENKWIVGDFPAALVHESMPTLASGAATSSPVTGYRHDAGVRFGVLQKSGCASLLVRNDREAGLWHFDGEKWIADPQGLAGLDLEGPVFTCRGGQDQGVRLCDLDLDGVCELVVSNPREQAVFARSVDGSGWQKQAITLPEGVAIVDAEGRDAGLRLVDLNGDGRLDVVFSNAQRYQVHPFVSMTEGWASPVLSGKQDAGSPVPMIVRADGANNGAWFSFGHMWAQNEETGGREKPSQAVKRSYGELLGKR